MHSFFFIIRTRKSKKSKTTKKNALILGVYLADRENMIHHIVKELSNSKHYHVDQKWIALLGKPPSQEVSLVTARTIDTRTPKYVLLNYLLSISAWKYYDFVIFVDDDIFFPTLFIDNFLKLQEECDFAIAQPARTHNSFISHAITEQIDGITARQTRFVEIGPIVSLNQAIAKNILPFDESSPMGWGFDFVWPKVVESQKMKMGIIDQTPVDHSMRDGGIYYDNVKAQKEMDTYLSNKDHLDPEMAFTTLKIFE